MELMAAETESALLSSDGSVMVNGKKAPLSTAVFPGDQITTGKEGNATVVAKCATVVLPADSAITFGQRTIQMQQGRAVINAVPGTEVRIGNLSITPSLKPAKFQLYQKGNDMGVSALEGDLNVSDGVDKLMLPAGEMMTHSAADRAFGADLGADYILPRRLPAKADADWAVATASAGAVGGAFGGMAMSGVFSSDAQASCSCSASASVTVAKPRNCK